MSRWPALLLLVASPLAAQSYRLQIDTRMQAVEFRGLALDSIPIADTVPGPGGGPATPDGFAVRCPSGGAYCTYFRPGAARHGAPLVATADLALWGFGIRGLSAHLTARAGLDLGGMDVWPGTEPALQLLSSYVEYAVERLTARAGRQRLLTRLGATGFDGGVVTYRAPGSGLEATAYGGWGLARGIALPVTSPALNPLDDFQPRRRQLVAGLSTAWTAARGDLRLEYQREVDPRSDYFVSERVALSGALRPAAGWSVAGGAEYDLAAAWWGSADLRLAWVARTATLSLGARRYRPHFALWTIWGAFSPVPYTALHAEGTVQARPQVRLRARGEWFRFADADATTPLVAVERAGWRGELGITATLADWLIDGGLHRESGPGAASIGSSAAVTLAPGPRYRVTLHGATLDRPLEFRYNEAVLHLVGLDADAAVSGRVRLSLGVARFFEDRRRPDAAAVDWSQWRLVLRVRTLLGHTGRGDELGSLPPAIRRMPGGRARR